jgi:hypothetical protein
LRLSLIIVLSVLALADPKIDRSLFEPFRHSDI